LTTAVDLLHPAHGHEQQKAKTARRTEQVRSIIGLEVKETEKSEESSG
jgi:hypothetical protein